MYITQFTFTSIALHCMLSNKHVPSAYTNFATCTVKHLRGLNKIIYCVIVLTLLHPLKYYGFIKVIVYI